MNNNDIFKKLRVALQLRDEQIIEILQLVDFRISKSELGAFFRNEDHPNYMDCGDQVLRNFLNGLVIHLRGTKENPKSAMTVINENASQVKSAQKETERLPKATNTKNSPTQHTKPATKKPYKKQMPETPISRIEIVEKVKFNNGKPKKK